MTDQIHKNVGSLMSRYLIYVYSKCIITHQVVDKDLKDWILPDFTTTSHNDTVVSAVLMMSTLKA